MDAPTPPAATAPLGPILIAQTRLLDIAYYEAGPLDGPPVLLLHGFPYDIHSYVDVIPLLADRGFRVIVPYLRGHGPTRFVNADHTTLRAASSPWH